MFLRLRRLIASYLDIMLIYFILYYPVKLLVNLFENNMILNIISAILIVVILYILILNKDSIIGYESIDNVSDPENYYALQVTGNSMEPLFSDGDIAIVHKQDDFDSGNTCIVLVNGDEATVKKVVRMDDGIDLIAMNPYYPIRHFSKNEMNEIPIKIIGKVVEARKRKIFE